MAPHRKTNLNSFSRKQQKPADLAAGVHVSKQLISIDGDSRTYAPNAQCQKQSGAGALRNRYDLCILIKGCMPPLMLPQENYERPSCPQRPGGNGLC